MASEFKTSILEHVLDLNLLRSPTNPDPDADLGHHEFTYSLLPHNGALIDSTVMAEATRLNQPPAFFVGRKQGVVAVPVEVTGEGVSLAVAAWENRPLAWRSCKAPLGESQLYLRRKRWRVLPSSFSGCTL